MTLRYCALTFQKLTELQSLCNLNAVIKQLLSSDVIGKRLIYTAETDRDCHIGWHLAVQCELRVQILWDFVSLHLSIWSRQTVSLYISGGDFFLQTCAQTSPHLQVIWVLETNVRTHPSWYFERLAHSSVHEMEQNVGNTWAFTFTFTFQALKCLAHVLLLSHNFKKKNPVCEQNIGRLC